MMRYQLNPADDASVLRRVQAILNDASLPAEERIDHANRVLAGDEIADALVGSGLMVDVSPVPEQVAEVATSQGIVEVPVSDPYEALAEQLASGKPRKRRVRQVAAPVEPHELRWADAIEGDAQFRFNPEDPYEALARQLEGKEPRKRKSAAAPAAPAAPAPAPAPAAPTISPAQAAHRQRLIDQQLSGVLLTAARLLGEEIEPRQYSGRGMFGSNSLLAFDAKTSPHSERGKLLVESGFTYDSMGRDWVYYLPLTDKHIDYVRPSESPLLRRLDQISTKLSNEAAYLEGSVEVGSPEESEDGEMTEQQRQASLAMAAELDEKKQAAEERLRDPRMMAKLLKAVEIVASREPALSQEHLIARVAREAHQPFRITRAEAEMLLRRGLALSESLQKVVKRLAFWDTYQHRQSDLEDVKLTLDELRELATALGLHFTDDPDYDKSMLRLMISQAGLPKDRRMNPEWARKLGHATYRGTRRAAQYAAEVGRDVYHGARKAHQEYPQRRKR